MNALIIQLVTLQVVLPLLLIGLHGLLIVGSMVGWWIRTLFIAMVLLLVGQTGVWLFPPWWTPWVLGALHVLASATALRRYRHRSSNRSTWKKNVEVVTGLFLSFGILVLLFQAFDGRRVPANTIALAAPLEAGRYLVTSGGTNGAINSHLKTLHGERFAAYRGQSYALDLIAIDGWGWRSSGISPVDPKQYFIYGQTVLAPCTGTVSVAVDGVADMAVPKMDRENMLGNHVIIECQGVFVVLAHLAPESLRVSAGEPVRQGDPIGVVGNSGNTAEPHLHIHVQASLPDEDPISAEPQWFTLGDRFLARNQVLSVQ